MFLGWQWLKDISDKETFLYLKDMDRPTQSSWSSQQYHDSMYDEQPYPTSSAALGSQASARMGNLLLTKRQ